MSPTQKRALEAAKSLEGLRPHRFHYNVVKALLDKQLIYVVATGGLYRATPQGWAYHYGLYRLSEDAQSKLRTIGNRDGWCNTAKRLRVGVATLDKVCNEGTRYDSFKRILRGLDDLLRGTHL